MQADEVRIKKVWDMNEMEAKELVKKIMHCDQVIHEQQLNVGWKPPSDKFFDFLHDGQTGAHSGIGDSSYKGADSETQGKSQMNQNTSIMESQHNQGQSNNELENDNNQSNVTGGNANHGDIKDKYERIKNVFKLLIDEAEYLIDDKALERCRGKSLKEQFQIKIDSIRKSLGIDELQYVDLLVDIIYGFQHEHEKAIAQKVQDEEQEYLVQENENGERQAIPDDNGRRGEHTPFNNHGEKTNETQENDPLKLRLDPDLLTKALKRFYQAKEDQIALELVAGQGKKKSKRSNFESEKETEERKRKQERIFWEKLVSILSEQKLSVWRALDKSMTKYYSLLVDRQNLIEETGLLNQQNEELKTLLNQYLQAGVNQELQVPPTQVISLNIR